MLAFSRELFGTRFEVALVGGNALALHALAEQGLDAAQRVARTLDRWDAESALARLNADPRTGWVDAPPELIEGLEFALRAWGESGGAFDVRVGERLRAAGYYSGGAAPDGTDAAPRAPSSARLPEELRVSRADGRVWRARALELDFGGFAKGFAVQRCAQRLRELGIANAWIAASSSSVYGLGAGPSGSGWEFRPPAGLGAPELLYLRDTSAAVSAQHSLERALREEASLILDAPSGSAAAAAAALVVGPDAALADMWSTALVALGVERARERVRAFGPGWRAWVGAAAR